MDENDGNNNVENDDDGADMLVQEEEIEKLREEVVGEKVVPILC